MISPVDLLYLFQTGRNRRMAAVECHGGVNSQQRSIEKREEWLLQRNDPKSGTIVSGIAHQQFVATI